MNQDIRTTIAEACGWKFNRINVYACGESYEVVNPEGYSFSGHIEYYHTDYGSESKFHPYMSVSEILEYPPTKAVPDYLNDHNAIHAAILTLNAKEQAVFGDVLNKSLKALWETDYEGWQADEFDSTEQGIYAIAAASTEQLCQAFLAAKGIRL